MGKIFRLGSTEQGQQPRLGEDYGRGLEGQVRREKSERARQAEVRLDAPRLRGKRVNGHHKPHWSCGLGELPAFVLMPTIRVGVL